jgi:alkylhydroperoxidase family enzyme
MAERMARIFPVELPLPQLYRTMARNEALFARLVDMGLIGPTGLLDRRTLPKALRETIVLRTCVAARNDYEFNLHVQTISERMGLDLEQIDDIRADVPSPALWSARARAAMRLVDGLVARIEVDDETFELARMHFDEPTLIEIVQIVGLYTGVAMQVALMRPRFDHYRPGPAVTTRVPPGSG